MAAAIGARLPVQDAAGSMIVDIGGGTTEVAVMSLGGIVASHSLRIAGNELTEDIINYAHDHFNLMLGERTAEAIKFSIGSVFPSKEKKQTKMRGRDLITGLPKEIMVSEEEIRTAMMRSVGKIVDAVKNTLEETPPELLADIMERGIVLAGGGALLKGLDKLVASSTDTKVHIADDPLTCVVRGTGIVLEDLDELKDVLLPPHYQQITH
jgi:rod shape-determining protein MreB